MAKSIDTSQGVNGSTVPGEDWLHYDYASHHVELRPQSTAVQPSRNNATNEVLQTRSDNAFYYGLAVSQPLTAIQQYMAEPDSLAFLKGGEYREGHRRRMGVILDGFDKGFHGESEKPNSLDDISEHVLQENKEAQINAYVPTSSTEQRIIAFPARNPVDGENMPWDMITGVERIAPLRLRCSGRRQRIAGSRARRRNAAPQMPSNADPSNGIVNRDPAINPPQGSPTHTISQRRYSGANHAATRQLQALSFIDPYSSASGMDLSGPLAEMSTGKGNLATETPSILSENSMGGSSNLETPTFSGDLWVDQNHVSVQRPGDGELPMTRYTSSFHGHPAAISRPSPTLSRPLFSRPALSSQSGETEITSATHSSLGYGGLGSTTTDFCPFQNQIPDEVLSLEALRTTHEQPNLQRYTPPFQQRSTSTVAPVAQEPMDDKIFEFFDAEKCSQDTMDDLCEKRITTKVV